MWRICSVLLLGAGFVLAGASQAAEQCQGIAGDQKKGSVKVPMVTPTGVVLVPLDTLKKHGEGTSETTEVK